MIVFIKDAHYVEEYKIALKFNTGEESIMDFESLIQSDPLAKPLTAIAQFKDFYLDPWPTLAWKCGYDIAPETLYGMATGKFPNWVKPPVQVIERSHAT